MERSLRRPGIAGLVLAAGIAAAAAQDVAPDRAQQERVLRVIVDRTPKVRDELVERGRDEGLAPLAHQFERRLRRRLRDDEHRALHERLRTLGPDRLGDVVLDLAPEALEAWLADRDAR